MEDLTNPNESWSQTKEKLKQKFAILTESDVLLIEDKKEELLERLQKKLDKTREEVEKLISEL